MKTKIVLLVLMLAASGALISCKGEAGPAGAAGANGETTAYFKNGILPSAGYAGTVDSYSNSGSGFITDNYGGCDEMCTGKYSGGTLRSYVRFDLSDIPPAITGVVSASMTFYCSYSTGTTTVTAYALTQGWTGGVSSCGGTGGVNISWANYDGAGNTWATPGGDYSATAISDTRAITTTGYVTFILDPDVVRGWIADPATNHGFMFKAENEKTITNYCNFYTGESGDTNPVMKVTYRLP
jgi:hypothetical protein